MRNVLALTIEYCLQAGLFFRCSVIWPWI